MSAMFAEPTIYNTEVLEALSSDQEHGNVYLPNLWEGSRRVLG